MTNPLLPILETLTKAQREELEELGVRQQRRSDWIHGRRRPTLAQIMVLCMVTNRDPKPLVEWLAEQEANEQQLAFFREVKTRRLGALLSAVVAVVLATPDPAFAQCSSGQTRFDPLNSGNAHCRQFQDTGEALSGIRHPAQSRPTTATPRQREPDSQRKEGDRCQGRRHEGA